MKKMRTIKIIAVVLFLISLFCTVDLGLNFLYNTEPLQHDGITTNSVLQSIFGIFGDSLWAFDRFFNAFKNSAWISFALLAVNAVLRFFKDKE